MELNDEFEVPLPVDEAWELLTDVEKVVAWVPGAELREVEGDEARGVVGSEVGPRHGVLQGRSQSESLDTEAHRLVLKAQGREIRGQGNVTAVSSKRPSRPRRTARRCASSVSSP